MAATASCAARLSALHCTPSSTQLSRHHSTRANDRGLPTVQRCALRAPLCSNLCHTRFLGTVSFLSGRPVLQEVLQKAGVPSLRKRAIEAKSGNKLIETVIGTGKTGLKVATDLVPSSIPRPVASTGVVVVGGLVLLSLLKSIVSTAVTLVVVGGLAYAAFMYAKKSDDSGSGGDGASDDDSLAEAKRIMDKYK